MAGLPTVVAAALAVAAVGNECIAGSGTRGCAAQRSVARESVLLQLARDVNTEVVVQKTRTHTCDTCSDVFRDMGGCEALQAGDAAEKDRVLALPEMSGCDELNCRRREMSDCYVEASGREGEDMTAEPQPMPCNTSCMTEFQAAGGCALMQNNSFDEVETIMSSDPLQMCSMEACNGAMVAICYPDGVAEGLCGECVADFEQNGGCIAIMDTLDETNSTDSDSLVVHIPAGCWPCGEDAVTHCMATVDTTADCQACRAVLDHDSCASILDPDSDTFVPPECTDIGQQCTEHVTADCAQLAGTSNCHTAVKGDSCFMHVRWAMETGVRLHPGWYPGLSEESHFEDFQQLLHSRNEHGCTEPCPHSSPVCRTAVPGEECYHHVQWARKVGIKTMPNMYPSELNEDSPFEDFQAWLHRLHHGNCTEPCMPLP